MSVRFATLAILVGASLVTGLVHAGEGDLEAAFARRLRRAVSVSAADRLRRQFEGARVAALGCRWQRARDLAPVACYEVLATELAWRIRSSPAARAYRADLDARCARTALNLRVPEADSELKFVTPACAARVRDARAIQAYRRADDSWSGD